MIGSDFTYSSSEHAVVFMHLCTTLDFNKMDSCYILEVLATYTQNAAAGRYGIQVLRQHKVGGQTNDQNIVTSMAAEYDHTLYGGAILAITLDKTFFVMPVLDHDSDEYIYGDTDFLYNSASGE